MGKSIIDSCLNLEIYKTGSKLNIYVLSGLGLIYSFWTQGIFLRILDVDINNRYIDELFALTFLKTYIILYLTTAVALVWGLHIHELRFIKLWGFVKLVEVILNIATFINIFYGYYRMRGYIPVIVLVLAFGLYVIMCVWHKSLLEISDTNNEEENIDLMLPKYEAEIPAVHKTTVVN